MDAAEKISRKLRSMKRYVEFLSSKRDVSVDDLEQNYERRSAVERNFQLALESALDIGEIIIAREGFEKPEDYRSVILILGKQGVLPEEFAARFSNAAGFRNILVHAYDDIDLKQLHSYLQDGLADLDAYASHIARYLA